MKIKKNQRKFQVDQLDQLKAIPDRDLQAAANGRARFLAEASILRHDLAGKPNRASRRFTWRLAMATLLVLVIFFAGSAGVARAAQDTLPGELLYPVKLLGEDVRLELTGDPQDKIEVLLQYVSVRINEIHSLAGQNLQIPVKTTQRLEEHVHQAFILAAGLDDESMLAALQVIRSRLEEQFRLMEPADGDEQAEMLQTRQMLQDQLRFVGESLGNPPGFRLQMSFGQEESTTSQSPGFLLTLSPEDGFSVTRTLGHSDGSPAPRQTPDPGKGPGPTGSRSDP